MYRSKKMLSVLADASKSKSAHGFFALIEGSRIDMAAHSNDPVGHLYDILAYQEAMVEVKAFVDARPCPLLLRR
jgi:alkaline phosphatase